MTNEEKQEVGVFRYGVICDLIDAVRLDYGEKNRLIQEKCDRQWRIPHSCKTSISRSTILEWVKKYKESGHELESLYPKTRQDAGKSKSIDAETVASLIEFRKKVISQPVGSVIEDFMQSNPASRISESSAYRLFAREGLLSERINKPTDRRKYEAELPNDLWQSDVMHGPKLLHKGKRRKCYLIAIIDDHSRFIINAGFYWSENLKTYLKVLEEAFLRRGLPRKLYVDNGAAFKSNHLKYVTAKLEIALIHAKPYSPQGKGKIERWFRTVRMSFLTSFGGETLEEINTAFGQWLTEKYHKKKHTSTSSAPWQRFSENIECIRAAPKNLTDYFRKTANRKVAKDRTVTLDGRLYEAPVSLIGQRIELLYHEDTPHEVEIIYKNRSYGIAASVNLHVNCRVKRDKNSETDIQLISKTDQYKGGSLL